MPDLNAGAAWPGWETVRLIGRGSFGAVYEIERDILGEKEKAALKVITIPQSSGDIDELYGEGYDGESITSTFKEHLRSIVAEYSLMRKMNGSANVVNCDDVRYVQHDDGIGWDIFIKMELLTPLTKALGKEVPDEQVIRIGSDICRALMLCKKHNIIHRDIKPANIFVSENEDYKLGDFGIAKTVEKTSGGTKIGTYEYMAPEVYHDQPYGSTVDIYSLGMVLYWLLNERRTPFLKLPPALPTNSEKEQARKRRFQGEALPAPAHGSDALKRIVLKAIAFDPKDRYQTADQMLRDLEALGGARHDQEFSKANYAPSALNESVEEGTMGVFKSAPVVSDAASIVSAPPSTEQTDVDGTIGAFMKREPARPVSDEVCTPESSEQDLEGTIGVIKPTPTHARAADGHQTVPETKNGTSIGTSDTPEMVSVPEKAEIKPVPDPAPMAEMDVEGTIGVFRKPEKTPQMDASRNESAPVPEADVEGTIGVLKKPQKMAAADKAKAKPAPVPPPAPERAPEKKPVPEKKAPAKNAVEPKIQTLPIGQNAPQKKKKTGLIIGIIGGVLALAAVLLILLLPKSGSSSGYQPTQALMPQGSGSSSSGNSSGTSGKDSSSTSTGTSSETYDILVWVPSNAIELTKRQINDFNNSNVNGIRFNATVVSMSETIVADQMLADVDSGADLYFCVQDQISRLYYGGALSKVSYSAASTLSSANEAGSVRAATFIGELWAYPLTSDNGYFMYYDKSVIPETDVDSLEMLIADCESTGRYFAFDNESAWYVASWFFATGCVSEWQTDESGNFVSVKDTFSSPEGLVSVKGLKKLVQSPIYLSSSTAAEFSSGAAVVVSGIWDYETAKSILGDNLGVTDLPSFTVDGKEYHLGSFSGCKLLGVKPQADNHRSAALHLLAQYLTDEKAQLERFYELSWGPSNLNAQKSEAVQANPGLAALMLQNNYATPQGQINGSWWDIAALIGYEVRGASNEAGFQAVLDNYAARIDAVLNRTDAEKNAWGVIGSICGTNWDTDFPMTEREPNVFVSERLELFAGDELKVRQGGSWDVNYGADGWDGANLVVEVSGYYIVCLDLNEGIVTIIPA